MNAPVWHIQFRPLAGCVGYPQIELRFDEFQSALPQYPPAFLIDGNIFFDSFHPIGDEPLAPKMASCSAVGDAPFCAGQGRHKNRAVGSAEVECQIEPFPTQRAEDVPMPPPGRTLRSEG